jgi:hypothetical protein
MVIWSGLRWIRPFCSIKPYSPSRLMLLTLPSNKRSYFVFFSVLLLMATESQTRFNRNTSPAFSCTKYGSRISRGDNILMWMAVLESALATTRRKHVKSHWFNYVLFYSKLLKCTSLLTMRGSVVGLEDRSVAIRVRVGSRPGPGVHLTSYPVGTRALSPSMKRQGRKTDHSPPTSAEVNKTWISTSTPPYAFIA